MRHVKYLIQRNLELFLNNKLNILLSLASIPIIISLYVFFLRDFLTDMVGQAVINPDYVKEFTDRIMFAGLLVVINTTTCFGILQICVNDSAMGMRRDFLVAPVSSFKIIMGYWIAAALVSGFFTFMTALGGELFFYKIYGRMLSIQTLLRIFGIILFSSYINAGILLCAAKNLKNTTTFSTFANLYGTVIGFLSGAYLPYYFYPSWLKPILLWFPPTQVTSILRKEYIRDLWCLPVGEKGTGVVMELLQNFGIELTAKGSILTTMQQWSMLILALAVILSYLWVSGYVKENTGY